MTALLTGLVTSVLVATRGDAQLVDPRRPTTLVVGKLRAPAPTERVDARRRGVAPDPLPVDALEIAFRHPLGGTADAPALVGEGGRVHVITTRGDVIVLDGGGEEIAHASVPAAAATPPTLAADGSVVFAANAGDVPIAVGVSARGHVQFTQRVLGGRPRDVAPLSLEDGGTVLAAGAELVVLDAQGAVRTRTALPEPPAGPLLAWRDRVLAVSMLGNVYAAPLGGEARRVGSFGAPVDGGAALLEADVLSGVVGGELVDLDVARGTRTSRGVPPDGVYLGPVAAWPPGGPRAVALLQLATSGAMSVVAVDAAGGERMRAALPGSSAMAGDGGRPLVVSTHAGVIADARGTVAFATLDGLVGVATPSGDVRTLSGPVCARVGRSGGVSGLTPAGPAAFVVTCQSGLVVAVRGGPGTSAGAGL